MTIIKMLCNGVFIVLLSQCMTFVLSGILLNVVLLSVILLYGKAPSFSLSSNIFYDNRSPKKHIF